MSDSYTKLKDEKTTNGETANGSAQKKKEEEDKFANMTKVEKLKAKEEELKKRKQKSMDAWGDTGEKKSFGVGTAIRFTFARVWSASCYGKFLVLINMTLQFVAKASQVANPLILMVIVDAIICQGSGKDVKECPTQEETYIYILFYAGIKLAYDMLHTIREIPFAQMSAQAEVSIANDVYDHVQRLSMAYHLSRETGKIIRIVSRGAQSFTMILRMTFYNILGLIIEILMTLAVSLTIFSWQFTAVQVFALVIYFTLTYVITERRAKGFKAQQTADDNYNQKATDGLLNFETVKYFNAEEHEEDRFEKALVEYKMISIKVIYSLVGLNITQSAVIALGLGLCLCLALYHFSLELLTVGGFVLFVQYNQQIWTPLSFLGTLWRFIRQAMVNVEQIMNLLEVNEKIPEAANPISAKIGSGRIEFRDVSFTYDYKLPAAEQVTVIDKLNFTIEPGTSVGIVGQTGSGKSTIMRLLYRFYDAQSGQILIDGQDITKMRVAELRNHIAIVPQDCVLFNDTLMYNIAYGALNDDKIRSMIDDPLQSMELIEAIAPAAKRSSIHPLIMKMKTGYWSKVGERGLKLSGGEKQRVAIARALLKRTPIMCFDEATSALDTETEKQVQAAIDEVAQGATSLIIAHRLSTVSNCDRIIVLKHGVIVEQGSHQELLDSQGYYAKLWNTQSEQQERMAREAAEKKREQEEYERALEDRKAKRRNSMSQARK